MTPVCAVENELNEAPKKVTEVSTISLQPAALEPEVSLQDDVYVFPATLEQGRYWILDQLEHHGSASNMAVAFRLEGPVNVERLKHSIAVLVDRHEALRTTFTEENDELVQVISGQGSFDFRTEDLSSLTGDALKEASELALKRHGATELNLRKGPLFAVALIRQSADRHLLAFTLSQIICDGWSNGVLVRELAEVYAAVGQGRQPNLPELPFQFADFSIWQQEWMQSPAAQSALEFWRREIRRQYEAVDLPTDQARSAGRRYAGEIESMLMTPERTAQLKEFARAHKSTLHIVLLAVFEALLKRYTAQSRFLLGSSIANRTQPGMEDVVGRFANPHIILADVDGDPTFLELMERVRSWSAEGYDHQDLPFSRVMEEFQLDHVGATNQFLQVYFLYQRAFMLPADAGDLQIIPRPSVSSGVNFDLLCSVVERAEGPRVQMEYNTELLSKARILELLRLFNTMLDSVMADPSQRLSSVPLTTDAELGLRREHNGAAVEAGLGAGLVERLVQHAVLHPTEIALRQADRVVTWGELNARVQSAASQLRQQGADEAHKIAVQLNPAGPTLDSTIALYATLAINATVLPLFAGCSQDADELVRAGLITAWIGEHAPEGAQRFVLEDTTEASATPSVTGNGYISVITRGQDSWTASLVPQGLAAALMAASAREINLTSNSRIVTTAANTPLEQFTSIALSLVSGAELLLDATDSEQVTHRFVSAQNNEPSGRGVTTIVLGTRFQAQVWLSSSLVEVQAYWLLLNPSFAAPVAVLRSRTGARLYPVQGLSLSLAGDRMSAQPAGAESEVVVSSLERSATTGLLAEYGTDGSLAAGVPLETVLSTGTFRMRLAELEDFLLTQDGIKEAVVLAKDARSSQPLAVFQCTNALSRQNLLAAMRAQLPPHLTQIELLSVSRLPRHADGSIAVEQVHDFADTALEEKPSDEYVGPRDEVEHRLAEIWEKVLQIRSPSVTSNFFDLGGYSLMIVRLFANINKTFSRNLSITTIFNTPTIEGLARVLRGDIEVSPLVPVQTQGERPPLFMMHSYLLYGGLPVALGTKQPFYGLREIENDVVESIEKQVARYLREIRKVQAHGPYHISGWCAAAPIAVEAARQLQEMNEPVGSVVLFDAWRPGYAEEVRSRNKGMKGFVQRLAGKVQAHRVRISKLPNGQRGRYLWDAVVHAIRNVRDRILLEHWIFFTRISRKLGIALPDFMQNVSRMTFSALREYRDVQYNGKVTLIRARNSEMLPGSSESCGWESIATGGVDVHWVEGDHETMFQGDNLGHVARVMKHCLDGTSGVDDSSMVEVAASGSGKSRGV